MFFKKYHLDFNGHFPDEDLVGPNVDTMVNMLNKLFVIFPVGNKKYQDL